MFSFDVMAGVSCSNSYEYIIIACNKTGSINMMATNRQAIQKIRKRPSIAQTGICPDSEE